MCSINGFNFKGATLILKMNEATRHRGPDATSVWEGKGITLGHNRLSIIDLSVRASQPMQDESKRFTIVFNGEIYNFKELKAKLQKKYVFRSDSDTEVILYAYREYGKDAVKKLNGIFAFAVFDAQKEELFLARDQSGVKPLYYFFDGKRFIFSSEIKAILEHDVPREVDREAFDLYMRVLYVPEPYTMFKGIKKLPPAHCATLTNGALDIRRYWDVPDFSDIGSREEATHTIRELFDDSIRRQLISDRPVGVFLSGGLDSTAVLGSVSKNVQGAVQTYSVGFDVDVQREKFNADFELAKKTARHYGTNHHELMISGKDVGEALKKIAWHLDEPSANPTAGAIYLLSRMAKKDVAVVLGGDGADELFGGYRRHALARLVSRFDRLPESLKKSARFLMSQAGREETANKLSLHDPVSLYLSFMSQKEETLSRILAGKRGAEDIYAHFKRYLPERDLSGDIGKRFMNTDRQSWLVDESLVRSDKMTMAFGLEERVPILDIRLVEYAYRVPTKWKLADSGLRASAFQGKQIWKDAILSYLPEHVLREEKRGWFTPMAKWLRTDLKAMVSDVLSPNRLSPEFFDAQEVQTMWHAHLDGTKYNLNLIFAIVMWQLWYDAFLRK